MGGIGAPSVEATSLDELTTPKKQPATVTSHGNINDRPQHNNSLRDAPIPEDAPDVFGLKQHISTTPPAKRQKLDPLSTTTPAVDPDIRAGPPPSIILHTAAKPKLASTGTAAKSLEKAAPLADRLRPRILSDVCGQDHLIALLRPLLTTNRLPSLILWGGPGTGKTTIARLLASLARARFVEINSTNTGVTECKKIFQDAKNELTNGLTEGKRTIVFCDEIHRFSKSQQDVFLGPVERGEVVLVGATTENPSFKVVGPLLSRVKVLTLKQLQEGDIAEILRRAISRIDQDDSSSVHARESLSSAATTLPGTKNLPLKSLVSEELLSHLALTSRGDARTALNLLDLSLSLLATDPSLPFVDLKAHLTHTLSHDRAGDNHYDTISAFHKSVRGSDPHAALYYLARMLAGGEDPLFVARRMVVIASEDIGLADNNMLSLATAAYSACEKIGMPECRINLAHCTVALALAKKSVRSYRGLRAAMKCVTEEAVGNAPIPLHLRNASTKLMEGLGYAEGYKYNPDFKGGMVKQMYLPEEIQGRSFLDGTDFGEEVDAEIGAGEEEAQGANLAEEQDLDLQVEL